jgi:membrane-associated protein
MIRSVDDMLNHLMPLVSSPWLYLVVFATVAIDGFLPFIPIEAAVIGLGALSATGRPNVLALAAAVTAGGMAGDRVTYLIGRTAGGRLRHRGLVAARNKAQRALARHGGTAILVGRFLPWGRSATALTAGSVSLPPGRFTLFTGLASAAWAAYSIGLGRLGGVAFANSPLLAATFGIVLGFALAGLHSGVKRLLPFLRPLLRPLLRRRGAGLNLQRYAGKNQADLGFRGEPFRRFGEGDGFPLGPRDQEVAEAAAGEGVVVRDGDTRL